MEDTVLDHVSDKNQVELYRLSKLYEFPDFVKKADFDQTLQPENLPASVYVDPRRADSKLYPCHNPASTWLSCLYFQEKQASFNKKDQKIIRERLDDRVQYWGIKEAVEHMREQYDQMHKNADDLLPDTDFAYVQVADTGHKQRHWRIKNAAEVAAAAEALFQNRDSLPFSDRHTIATKIMEKASQYGASLGDRELFIERQAGRGFCEPAEVVKMLYDRAKLASDETYRNHLIEFAQMVDSKASAALMPDVLVKLAETVDMIDRAVGLVRGDVGYYTDMLPRPEDVIFKATISNIKEATDSACALVTGSVYDKSQFSKVSTDDLTDLFGKDIADQVTSGLEVDPEKLAEVAQTFPRGDAELFERMLSEVGIPPMAHKAASDRVGITPTMLESLAKRYVR